MFRVAFKDLMARKRRLVTTGIAVILGIAFLSGTQILGGVLNATIDDLISDVYSGYDAVVRSPDVQETGFGDIRSPVDAKVVKQVSRVDGVRAAFGVVESPAVQLVGRDGKVLTSFGPPTLVFNWFDDPVRPGILKEGRGPTADDEIAMDFKTAEDNGWSLGDKITVAERNGTRSFTLVGVLGLGTGAKKFSGAKPLYFTTKVAQELSGQPGQFNYVAAGAKRGVSQAELAERLAAALPNEQVVTGAAFTKQSSDDIAKFVSILTTVVTVFGVIALVVAAFIIYNTFSIIVAQRTRETALLRAIGASRRQVVTATVVEAVIIGVVASVIGLVLGTLLATGLKAASGAIFSVQPGLAHLGVSTVVLSFAIGVGVTALSAVIPAVRASRIPPIAAISEVSIDRSSLSRARQVWGTVLVVAGVALVALGLTDTVSSPLLVVGAGLLLLLVSVAVVLGPMLARPASIALAWPWTSRRSITARLAAENAARNPRRTAATAAALTVGVTLVVVITVLATSIKSSVSAEVEGALDKVDFIVSAGTFSFLGVPPQVAEKAPDIDGVSEVSPVKFTFLRLLDKAGRKKAAEEPSTTTIPSDKNSPGTIFGVGNNAPPGEDVVANGADVSNYFDLVDMGDIKGNPKASPEASIIAQAKTAKERGWKLGDTIPVYFAATGRQDLKLVATYSNGLGPRDNYYLSNETVVANSLPGFDSDFAVYIATTPDADRAQVQKDLDQLAKDRPDVVVQDRAEFVKSQTGFIDVFVAIIYGLLALAVIIALIGIANTLSLSVLERTREFGLLRAVGMSRRQLRRTVRAEAAIVAVFGTLMGIVIGIAFAVALSFALTADDPGLLKLRIPIIQLVVITVVAALAGLVTAILPARRAARLDVLKAIATE